MRLRIVSWSGGSALISEHCPPLLPSPNPRRTDSRLPHGLTIVLTGFILTNQAASSARAAFQRIYHRPSTDKPRGACPGCVVDHVIPLCAGGADDPLNMQWQTLDAGYETDVSNSFIAARRAAGRQQDTGRLDHASLKVRTRLIGRGLLERTAIFLQIGLHVS
jgi:hypothetical protein